MDDIYLQLYQFFVNILFNGNDSHLLKFDFTLNGIDYLMTFDFASALCNALTLSVIILIFMAFVWLIKEFFKTFWGLF